MSWLHYIKHCYTDISFLKKKGTTMVHSGMSKKKTLMYLSKTTLIATTWRVADCGWESEEWETTGERICWATEHQQRKD